LRSLSFASILPPMQTVLRYRGRDVTEEDVRFIRQLIAEHPGDSRFALSKKLCTAWNWVQQNGQKKDMVCRGLMLALHRQGHITLPPAQKISARPGYNRKEPVSVQVDQSPLTSSLKDITPLEFRQVRKTPHESLFSNLLKEHHYLGYTQPVGEHLKYLVFANNRPIACLSWSSAPRHIGSRDNFIGWTQKDREKNLSLIAYNSRFLILPWVRVSCLASHILAQMAKILARDWESIYKHPIYYLETFVDQGRFKGTCYFAANWLYLGETTGRGKNDQTGKANRSLKAVLGYPLTRDFRKRLCEVSR